MPLIVITQWREYGDDEDYLDIRVAESESAATQAIAEEFDLQPWNIEDENPVRPGVVMVTTQFTIEDGEELLGDPRIRVRLEPF